MMVIEFVSRVVSPLLLSTPPSLIDRTRRDPLMRWVLSSLELALLDKVMLLNLVLSAEVRVVVVPEGCWG